MSRRTRQVSARPAKSASQDVVELDHRASPTPERLRRAGPDFKRGAVGQITVGDNPLDRSLARGVITREQYLAAQRYRHHWYYAGLAERLESVDLNVSIGTDPTVHSGMARSEAQVFHRQRYREAVQTVGKIGSQVLDWVVCREVGLEQIGYALGWSSRPQAYAAAVERMRMALDVLCKLWRMG